MSDKPSSTRAPKKTGPKTPAGKATSSMNATQLGTHVTGWLDEFEQAEFEALRNSLSLEYNAQTPTMMLQIERLATTMVKMRRLQKIETALFMKARQIAKRHSAERPRDSGQSSVEVEQLSAIAELSAMPDMDRLSTLQRYQTSLDRQLSKIIGEIRVLKDTPTIVNKTTSLLGQGSRQTITRFSDESTHIVSEIDEDPTHGAN